MKNALTLSGLFTAISTLPAMAQEGLKIIGKPVDGLTGFQPAATELARDRLSPVAFTRAVSLATICGGWWPASWPRPGCPACAFRP